MTITVLQPMALLHLVGQGDAEIKLVSIAMMDWIEHDYAPPGFDPRLRVEVVPSGKGGKSKPYPNSYTETMPPSIAQEFRNKGDEYTEVNVSICSFQNDRALCALAASTPSFTSIRALIAYVKDHNIDIVREFEGHIY